MSHGSYKQKLKEKKKNQTHKSATSEEEMRENHALLPEMRVAPQRRSERQEQKAKRPEMTVDRRVDWRNSERIKTKNSYKSVLAVGWRKLHVSSGEAEVAGSMDK
jgi:uncharacterized protein (DUF1800 family)